MQGALSQSKQTERYRYAEIQGNRCWRAGAARKGQDVKLSTRVRRRRRQPREFSTAATAIRNHCLECCGYDAAEVERCTCPACWLYPWRFKCSPRVAQHAGRVVDFPQNATCCVSGAEKATSEASAHPSTPLPQQAQLQTEKANEGDTR
jgi:hypothetical protein